MGTLELVWVPNGPKGEKKKGKYNRKESVFVKSGNLPVHVCSGGIYNDKPYPFILVRRGCWL